MNCSFSERRLPNLAAVACLILALAVCLYGIGASLYGARRNKREWVASGRRAVYAVAATTALAFAILEAAFLRSDFSFALVTSHSSTTTPTFYRATAVWSSQEGSLLLWLLLLSLWSSLILFATRRRLREIAPYATAVLLGLGAFFAALLVFLESPFDRTIGPLPAEGVGLNPLLRHPSMMIHPPMLYSGYTLFAVPFAFAVGALVTRRLNADWIRGTRPFTLAAWFFLGVGIVLGSRWSYTELGWGGYWAWDPVENASLMPWLTGTAFLHSVMIQEKRGMLKVWNVSLVLATGVLAILGTFLVRSGILDSIHAFGASTLGVPFLALIAVMNRNKNWPRLTRCFNQTKNIFFELPRPTHGKTDKLLCLCISRIICPAQLNPGSKLRALSPLIYDQSRLLGKVDSFYTCCTQSALKRQLSVHAVFREPRCQESSIPIRRHQNELSQYCRDGSHPAPRLSRVA